MFNKKATMMLKIFLIIIISSIILISFLIILVPHSSVYIDDKKIRTQMSLDNVLNCFSEESGVIEGKKYSSNQLDLCLKNQENVLMRIKLEGKDEIFLNDEEENFESKKEISCRVNSNILCTDINYPVILKENNEINIKILEVQILME